LESICSVRQVAVQVCFAGAALRDSIAIKRS
jgi:hypothetical protein